MAREPESPRFVLILGGLFLIAYAAYQVGSAWMAAYPPAPSTQTLAEPYPAPESAITPLEPYPKPESTSVAAYPSTEDTEYPAYPYPGTENSDNIVQPYPDPDIATNPVQPYPELELTITPADAAPTLTPSPTQAQPITPTLAEPPTHTPTNLPTATPEDGAYPGPEQTSTPINTATLDPDDPYPGPEQTPTPALSPTPQPSTPTLTPTWIDLPTLVSTPTMITTLPFTEILIISDGSVNQAVWLDEESDLALATSNGIFLHQLFADEPEILDEGVSIVSIVYIPGDDWIAAGGRDSLIRIWDVSTGSFVKHLSGHLLGVVRLSHSSVRSFLASASDDATVRIWNDDGSPLHILRGPITRVMDMAVSLNGHMVAAVSNQHVHIWNPQTAELLHTISQPLSWYTAVAFNGNSQELVTAYDGLRLEFWDTATWERVDFIALDSPVQSLAYSPDGRMLAIGYVDGRIQIRDSYYDLLLADIDGHPEITSMAFSPYEDQLVTSSADGSIRLWDLSPLLNP